MQKKIIALAIAGMSSVAFAQSNVTISGNMEMHVDSVSAGGATTGVNYVSRTRLTNNTSAVRLSGTENLGNGLTALFQIEQDINGDTQAATGWSSRNTFVGLTGNFGTAIAGRHDVHYTSHMVGGVDFGSAGALPHAANTLNLVGQVSGVGVIGGRLDNVVAYITPSFSGFKAQIGYQFGTEATTPGITGKSNAYNFLFTYANGPVNAFWSNTKVNHSTDVSNTNDVRADRLGAAYTFPMGLKVGLVYDNTKIDAAGALAAKRTAWALPISYTTGAHGLYFAWAKAGNIDNAAGSVADTGAKNVILGYTYSLSKRTQLGVSYSAITNDAAGRYDFWTRNVSGLATGLAAAQAGADPRNFSVGINHTF
jgi:predicted porin